MGRNFLHLCMGALWIAVMDYRFTGNLPHEAGGVLLLALLLAHNAMHRRWYAALRRGKQSPRRAVSTAVNLLLAAVLLAAFGSGVYISNSVFAFLGTPGGIFMHEVHQVSAYAAFLLTAVHLGLHGELLAAKLARALRLARTTAAWRLLRAAFWLVAAYGVYAAQAQRIAAKLLAKHVVSWDAPPSLWGFAFDYLAVAAACMGAARLFARALPRSVAGAARRKAGSLGFTMKEEV